MKKYELAIFDLDGTLLYTLKDLANSTNYALKENNLPERTLNEIQNFVGNGIKKLIERAVPKGTSEECTEKTYTSFMMHYTKHCMDYTKIYDGILEMLGELQNRNIKIAIVSNKADVAVKKLCDHYFKSKYNIAVGAIENIPKKPAPDSVFYVINKLNININKTIYIGDSEVDIQTAKNAGIPCISVSWGFKSLDFLQKYGATMIANKANDIITFIDNN